MKRLLLVLPLSACSDAGVTKFNTPPTAELSSHASGDTVREGYLETLRGTVGDANHPIESLVVAWLVDGVEVCTDAVPDADGLVTCAHTFLPTGGEVVLEVRDPEGGSGSDRLTVDVQPTDAPVAVLTAPTASGVYYADQLTTLEGTVSDAEDDATDLSVVWESSLDGPLTGGFDTPDSEGGLLGATTLQEGEHFLTLTVTDSTGKEGRDSVTVQVGPANSAPSCGITAPADGSAGADGEEVRFEAVVADVDVPADWLSPGVGFRRQCPSTPSPPFLLPRHERCSKKPASSNPSHCLDRSARPARLLHGRAPCRSPSSAATPPATCCMASCATDSPSSKRLSSAQTEPFRAS